MRQRVAGKISAGACDTDLGLVPRPMSTTTQPQKAVPNVQNPVIETLESVKTGRVTVKRVLEYVRGDRPADRVSGSDFLGALDHARRDADETLALYLETEKGVVVFRRGDHGAIRRDSYSVALGNSKRYHSLAEAEDLVHRTAYEVVTEAEARARFRAFLCDAAGFDAGEI